MQMYSLPAGGAVGVGEVEVSPVTLYTKQHFAHKHCFIRHYIQDETNIFEDCQFPSEIQWNTAKHPHRVLILKHAILNHAFSPPGNHSNFHRGIYFNDILMDCFVISQTPENNTVVQTSRSFVIVLEKGLKKNLPLEWTFRFVTF